MEDLLGFNLLESVQKITAFIKEITHQTGIKKLVIGLSGGVDSGTSAALAVAAVQSENIFPLLLPYGILHQQAESDAQKIVEQFHIPQRNVTRMDIQPIADQIFLADPSMDRIRKGNIMARLRMIHLFDQAKKNNALVLGTENKTEHLLGYFTRFGDSASDMEPLLHLYKTQVRTLAAFLGVPQAIITKHPTAGLWEGQTDEGEFGFSYEDADRILTLFQDRKKTKEEIVSLGFSEKIIKDILDRMKMNTFKHRTPYHLSSSF